LLDRLIPVRKDEQVSQCRRVGVNAFSQVSGGIYLLVGSDAAVPLIVDIICIVIGRAVPVDEFAIRWNGYKVKPMTREVPAPLPADAIPAPRTTLPTPSTAVMSACMTCTMTGAAITATRPMSYSKS
jgi:hypothetical protein